MPRICSRSLAAANRARPDPLQPAPRQTEPRASASVLRAIAALALLTLSTHAATRPRYGGTLRVEIRESFETADPPQAGPTLPQLNGPFTITLWEGKSHATFAANENASGGRPFVDSIDIQLGRTSRDASIDLELNKADIVELDAGETRRVSSAPRRTWTSSPVRLVALVFSARIEDARIRQALAMAVDRTAIANVLLQRQGEITGALLPQWLSGYAFLFPTATDVPRGRELASAVPLAARSLTIASDAWTRRIADRIVVNARDVGLTIAAAAPGAQADVRLVELRISFADPAAALTALASALGFHEPPRADTPDALYNAERALLEGYRVVPLVHLPVVYGVGPRVKGPQGITPLGEWRLENVWLEGRP